MKLLILGLNYAPETVGVAVYTTGMAEALVRLGHQVQVVAGQPYYPAWKIMAGHSAWRFARSIENGVDVLRVPHYVPARPTGVRRLAHHASFALSALVPTIARALVSRPDVVLTIGPSLIAAPIARLAAALCGARSWLHIQDFEVEAAFATGLLPGKGFLGRLALGFERATLKSFDVVSAISPQMCRKLADKGVPPQRITEFRNWVDVDAIAPLAEASPYRARWGIYTPHVALYAGNIANKQGIDIIIHAARRLAHRRDLSFVICGEGPNRASLEALAAGLPNVRFHDLQPRQQLGALFGLASIHLLPQLAGAADLVLPSKLTNMLASGRPLIATAAPGTGLAAEAEGCGLVVPPADVEAFAGAIETLLDDPALYARAAAIARQRALDRWAAAPVLAQFEHQLGVLASTGRASLSPAGAKG